MSRTGTRTSPPARAVRLLEATLPEGAIGSSIIGDLDQEYDELAGRAGKLRRTAWYWRQSLALAFHYTFRVSPHGIPSDEKEPEIMSALLSDVRFGVRQLTKTPAVSLIAIFTIALGIALTVHTFSLVYSSVLRGIDIPGEDRLMHIRETVPELRIDEMSLPIHDYLDFRDQTTSFEELGGYHWATINLAGDGQPPERLPGAFVTANALSLLGIAPHLGSTFAPGDDAPGAEPKIVLSHDVWQSRFGGDPSIVGSTIRANGEATLVLGVMPPGFRFPFDQHAWMTHRVDPAPLGRREGARFEVFGRLREEVSVEQATAEVAAVNERIREANPEAHEGIFTTLLKHEHYYMPPQILAAVWVQLAAVFGVLLIACANVANLLLARAAARGHEVAIRTALGAARFRVVRQFLVESLMLASIGGAIGFVAAKIGVDRLNAALVDIQKPYWVDMRVDPPVVLFAFGITLLSAVLAGIIPAIRASGRGAGAILQDESRGTSLRMGRFSSVLVVGEVAISVALLIAAGLMIKSAIKVNTLDLGFRTENVLTARLGLFDVDYPERADREVFFGELLDGLRAQPGIEQAALTTHVPGTGSMSFFASIEGETYESETDHPVINAIVVSTGFFDAYEVPFLSGRDFRPEEQRSGSDPVAIVNASFVERFFPDRDPIGRQLKIGRLDSESPWMRIIGVVPDLHIGGGVGGLGSDRNRPDQFFMPMSQRDVRFMSVVARTRGPASSAVPEIREVVADLDPNMPIYEVASMDEAMENATWAFDLFGKLFSSLGAAALFLASVGLYGVMAFAVSRRQQEFGIRMALGARGRDLLELVLRKGVAQLAIGVSIGLVIGFVISRPLRAVTFGVETSDPTVYAAIVLTLAATGLIATVVPARRASRVDPNEALRID